MGMGSASGLGYKRSEILGSYQCEQSFLHKKYFGTDAFMVGMLSESTKNEVLQLKKENHQYKNLDLSVLYALFASRIALKQAGWKENTDVGINIGSSRGATGYSRSISPLFYAKIAVPRRFLPPPHSEISLLG